MVITIEQAMTQLDALIDRSTAGEEVLITRGGLPVARVVAVGTGVIGVIGGGEQAGRTPVSGNDGEPAAQRLGWGKDIIASIAPDFDEPLEDFREHMD